MKLFLTIETLALIILWTALALNFPVVLFTTAALAFVYSVIGIWDIK